MEAKKPDLRDQAKPGVTPTNTDSRMAGGDDRRDTVAPHSDMHVLTPGIGGKVPDGQVTKSS